MARRARWSPTLGAYRVGSAAMSLLPGPFGRSAAEAVAVVAGRSGGVSEPLARRRALVSRHLRRVYGPSLGERQLARRADDAFASYGRYWAENLRLPHVSGQRVVAGFRLDGAEHLERAAAAGRGTILALPHLGGWEWGGRFLVETGRPVSVVVEALEPPEVFEWFVEFRRKLGMEVIPLGPGATSSCVRALAANRVLGLLCDRVVGGALAVEVDFFGERTSLPAGPATLGFRTGAAVLPTAVYFGGRTDDHLAVVRPPVRLERRGRLRDDVAAGTSAIAQELEGLIRRAPTQWHLLQPNWPSDPPAG